MASASSSSTEKKGWRRSATRANATRKRWLTLVKTANEKVAGQQYCGDCKVWLGPREWATHQFNHTLQRESKPDPEALPVSPVKTRERQRRAGSRNPAPRPAPQRRKPATPDPSEREGARTVRVWRKQLDQMEAYMATGQGNPPSAASPFAQAVASAFQRWGSHVPETKGEIQAHLIGMTAALGIGAKAARDFAANAIVGQRLHPAIASPIESAADGLDEDRLEFTRAYVLLLRIYAPRIEHEEQSGPKPDEKFWKTGS